MGRWWPAGTLAGMALALGGLIVWLPWPADWCVVSPDSFTYLSAARALVETGTLPAGRLVYPPGFPAVLAGLMSTGDPPLLAARVVFALCWAATVVLTALLARLELGTGWAWVAGLLVVTNGCLARQATVLLSELVYLPLFLGAVVAMTRWRRASSWGGIAAAGMLGSAAMMVRTIGVVLWPVGIWALLMPATGERRSLRGRMLQAGLFSAVFLAPAAAWEARQRSYPPAYGYGSILSHPRRCEQTDATGVALQARRLAAFGPMRLESLKAAMVPQALGWRVFQPPLDRPATWAVGGMFVCVAVWRTVRRRSVPDACVLGTLLVLAVWPWDEKERLIVPLVPLLCLSVADMIRCAWQAAERLRPARMAIRLGVAGMFLVLAAEIVPARARLRRAETRARQRMETMRAMADWQRANVPAFRPILCLTPAGCEARLFVAGSAYLSRRPVENYIDLEVGESPGPHLLGGRTVLLHESLEGRLEKGIAAAIPGRCGSFLVLPPGSPGADETVVTAGEMGKE
jgi:hypothetical protein